ncbi:LysR substrate-binding domain-containing protein [Bdellovibrio bacteriovorus]|uniref:LysR family transcriptional regulator n=1 Tax=Bdellovibrio bacteriovorus TaxID=959 RepID=UPI000313CE7A|nr:LysR family transcriptional regulator [Bdellovibrio bacteriovorus]
METIRSLQGIIAFVKIADSGSFSAAAQALGVSKSHISKTISLLESDLGVALFVRSTRKVQLTSVGERFLETCRQSLQNLDSAKKEILDLSNTPRGVLRVTLAGIFGEEYIAPVVIDMAKRYPDLKIELDFSSRVVDLIEEKFDVAIRIGHLENSSLLATKIASRVEYVVASKAYLSAAPSLKEPEDLANHNCIGERSSWSFRKRGKSFHIPVKGNFKCNNPRVLQKAALTGLGIARLPGSYAFEDIKKGRLISLLENFSEGRKDIWAVTPIRHKQNINVKIFIQEVKKHLSDDYADVLF